MVVSRFKKKKNLASSTRHYLDYQAKTEESDGEGGFTEVWENISGGTQIPTKITRISSERRAEMRSWNVVATHYLGIRTNIPVVEVGRAVFSTPGGDRYFYVKTSEIE